MELEMGKEEKDREEELKVVVIIDE